MSQNKFSGDQFDGLKKEANKLKVYKSSGTAGPGYVQRPKLASAPHPIKENKTGLPKMALPEKRLPYERLLEKRLPGHLLDERHLPEEEMLQG